MKNLMMFLFSGILLLSCNSKSDSQPEKLNSYNKEGLTFDLPKYWEIGEDSQREAGRYMEIKNEEPFGSGLVVMSIFDSIQENLALVELMNNNYRSIFSEQNIQYEILHQPKEITIGSVKATESNGQIQLLGEKEKIRLVVYDLSGKTVCFALTTGSEDYKENVKKSEEIIKSMKLD